MNLIFEIIDKTGRKIHLSKERWSHITTIHSEMNNYLEQIKQTLIKPSKIVPHEKENLRNYYSYLKHRKHPEKYLRIIVKYLNNHGFIITTLFVRDIK